MTDVKKALPSYEMTFDGGVLSLRSPTGSMVLNRADLVTFALQGAQLLKGYLARHETQQLKAAIELLHTFARSRLMAPSPEELKRAADGLTDLLSSLSGFKMVGYSTRELMVYFANPDMRQQDQVPKSFQGIATHISNREE